MTKKDEIKQVAKDSVIGSSSNWNRWDADFLKAERLYGVSRHWLKAIALNESSLGHAKSVKRGLEVPSDVEGSISFDGKSWGLMQFTIPTARDYDATATPEKLNNAAYSIDLAGRFFRDLKKRFDAKDPRYIEWVIKSYNQGAGNTNRERRGQIAGYAQEYWDRFQRNLLKVLERDE